MGEAVHETADATWTFLFDVNARTLLHAVRAVVPHMIERGGGAIVNVGAFSAQRGVAEMGAYCASKSVVIRLTEAMAAELRERHVNVNCVSTTTLDTPENRAAMPNADPGRWVALGDLASVVVFLASDAARAIHGAAVPVTGLGFRGSAVSDDGRITARRRRSVTCPSIALAMKSAHAWPEVRPKLPWHTGCAPKALHAASIIAAARAWARSRHRWVCRSLTGELQLPGASWPVLQVAHDRA